MKEKIVKMERPLTDPKERLLKAAGEICYDDNKRRVRRHLENMAEMVDKYERGGYEVIVYANTREFGSIEVYLSPKNWETDPSKPGSDIIEVEAYEMLLDPVEMRREDFKDPYPSKESLRAAFDAAVAKIEKIKANKLSLRNKKITDRAA